MEVAIGIIVAAAVGGLLGWLAMCGQLRRLRARELALAEAVRKLNHDLRGALSPALLMAERLETHADPAVSQAAATITKALDRAAEAGKPAAVMARTVTQSNAAGAKPPPAE